jgi:hypothetical protein
MEEWSSGIMECWSSGGMRNFTTFHHSIIPLLLFLYKYCVEKFNLKENNE